MIEECGHTKSQSTIIQSYDEEDCFKEVIRIQVEDISDHDLHRYKCNQCGRMYYYSHAAYEYFEKGIENYAFGFTKEDEAAGSFKLN